MSEDFYSKINKDDYIYFVLEDDEVIDAKKELSRIYPNIMLLEFDNEFTRSINKTFDNQFESSKTLDEHFLDFYKKQVSKELDDYSFELVSEILKEKKWDL